MAGRQSNALKFLISSYELGNNSFVMKQPSVIRFVSFGGSAFLAGGRHREHAAAVWIQGPENPL